MGQLSSSIVCQKNLLLTLHEHDLKDNLFNSFTFIISLENQIVEYMFQTNCRRAEFKNGQKL